MQKPSVKDVTVPNIIHQIRQKVNPFAPKGEFSLFYNKKQTLQLVFCEQLTAVIGSYWKGWKTMGKKPAHLPDEEGKKGCFSRPDAKIRGIFLPFEKYFRFGHEMGIEN